MLDSIRQKVGFAGLTIKTYSPEIYLGAGIMAGIGSVILIAKAHKKSERELGNVLVQIDGMVEDIDRNNELAEEHGTEVHYITTAGRTQLLAPLYVDLARQATILYGPGVLMGVSSIALILASHGVLRGRNRSLITAVGLLERGFSTYRKRVIDELGEDFDNRFYYGAEARTITQMEMVEDGKKKKTKRTENHLPENPSPIMYQRIFDDTNINWYADPDLNELFLRSNRQIADDKLNLKGYILLNEVYKNLGFEETPEGAVVGWSLNVPGDDYVSFGLDNPINNNPGDSRWILDFNVNGVVFDTIGE